MFPIAQQESFHKDPDYNAHVRDFPHTSDTHYHTGTNAFSLALIDKEKTFGTTKTNLRVPVNMFNMEKRYRNKIIIIIIIKKQQNNPTLFQNFAKNLNTMETYCRENMNASIWLHRFNDSANKI